MTPLLRGVVVCHGTLAEALVDAAEQVSGVAGVLEPISNSACDRGLLEEKVLAAIGGGPGVVFVDMASGSCFMAAARALRAVPGVVIISGVNLAMLIDFLFHRDMSAGDAAQRAIDVGARAMAVR